MMALSATLEGSSQMTLLARTTRARLMKRTERESVQSVSALFFLPQRL